jgi:hypothetical protein
MSEAQSHKSRNHLVTIELKFHREITPEQAQAELESIILAKTHWHLIEGQSYQEMSLIDIYRFPTTEPKNNPET